jgi:hypothetical protein
MEHRPDSLIKSNVTQLNPTPLPGTLLKVTSSSTVIDVDPPDAPAIAEGAGDFVPEFLRRRIRSLEHSVDGKTWWCHRPVTE